MTTESRIELLSSLPDQPFRALTALNDGVPRSQLARLVADGLLRRPLRGVLVKTELRDDVHLRAAAIGLLLPPGSAVCRVAAAWLWGVDARPIGAHRDDPVLECVVPRGRVPVRHPNIRCYTSDIAEEDIVDVDGVACMSPTRTAIDLARWSMPGVGLATLDAMARARLIDPAELLVRAERWNGDRFIAQARRLISLCDPRAESAGESWARLRFCDAGFPVPELQVSLCDDRGVEVRRLDLGYTKYRSAWEYDGEEYHGGEEAERADLARRAEIESRWGWSVLGVGKNLVLGPSMALEYAIGEVIGMQPAISRRTW